MKLIDITNSIKRFTNPVGAATDQLKKELKKDNKRRLSMNLSYYRTFKADMQQDALNKAIDCAVDPFRPDRTYLLGLYKETMRDPHLLSQIRTNILKVIWSPFAVFIEGTDTLDEKATKLLQKPWFNRFRYIYHETPYFGHTLVEFQEMVKPYRDNGLAWEFKKIKVFPREYVRPETGQIVLDLANDKGIPYRKAPWNEWLLEIGDPHDIGLLNIATREVIWKNYSRSDWSRLAEKYGLPSLIIKSSSSREEEVDEMAKAASDFGSNLWMIIDDEDEFEVQWPKNIDGHKIFKDKADFCDAQNSKLIVGQTGTSDQKAFVGAAQVHENILNEYTEEAMRNETFYNNEELFPFLIEHGYPLEGREFRYLAFMNDEDEADNNADSSGEESAPPDDTSQKAKANFTKPLPKLKVQIGKGLKGTLTSRIEEIYHADCCQHHVEVSVPQASVIIDESISKAMYKVYQKKLKAGGVDKELFYLWGQDLWSSTLKGYDVKLDKIKYGSNQHELVNQLRYNIHVFAAFKNHHHTNELVNALVDGEGNIRSFSKFKKAAGLINTKYNKTWLATEHTQALLSGRNAQRWQKIKARKKTFPNVEYVTVNDSRRSKICEDLSGGVWSIDDPILKNIAPSNHWRCRSFLRSSKKTLNSKNTGEKIQPAFKNNAGISGNAFGDKHPYYDVAKDFESKKESVFGFKNQMPISPVQQKNNIKLFNALDKDQYSEINTLSQEGGWYAINKLSNVKGLKKNKRVARTLAKNGLPVEVNKHTYTKGKSNPVLTIDGVLSDVKTPTKPYGLDNLLKKAKKQGLDNVVYEIIKKTPLKDVSNGLRRGFKNRSHIDFIYVMMDKKLLKVTRKMYKNRAIEQELIKMWR